MKKSLISRISIVGLFTVCMLPYGCVRVPRAQEEDHHVREVPLAVSRKTVRFEPLFYEQIRQVASPRNFAVFSNHRQIWIKESGQRLTLLSDIVALPGGFDWYETLCAAGDRVAVSVGRYPEDRRHQEVKSPRGEFKAGPEVVGVLVFTSKTAKLIPNFRVDSVHARVSTDARDVPLPTHIIPPIQSCHWDGSALIVGAYGLMARLDLERESASLLDFDDGLQFNRPAIFVEGNVIWVSLDEGGLGGGCIAKLSDMKSEDYCLLGYNNSELDPDAILRYKGRVVTSSLVGVVEIDERRKSYIHYQLITKHTQMRVFRLSVLNGELWAVTEDGWVKFDLARGKATRFRLAGDCVSDHIYSLTYFDDTWFVATEDALVVVDPRDLK